MFNKTLFIFIFLLATTAHSAVVFEDNFNSHPDWKTTLAFAHGTTCVEGVTATTCSVTNWSGWANDESWNPYDNVIAVSGSRPGLEISNFNYYGASGKSLTITNEQHHGNDSSGWGSDSMLKKALSEHHTELYIQFRIKYQSGFEWIFDESSSHAIKTFRLFNWDGTGSVPSSYGDGSTLITPGFFLDGGQGYYGYGLQAYFRCAPQGPAETLYDCTTGGVNPNTLNGGDKQAEGLYPGTTPYNPAYGLGNDGMAMTYADGSWRKITIHTKMNTFTGATPNSDGVYELWFDDVLVLSYSNYQFARADATTADKSGWNMIAIGGNNYQYLHQADSTSAAQRAGGVDTHSTVYEAWYAIDDVVVSTTTIPTDYVIGDGSITCYPDIDADLYPGSGSETVSTCSANYYESSHFTAMIADCNDSNANINPGETDACGSNGIDEDCSGSDNTASCTVGWKQAAFTFGSLPMQCCTNP